MKARCSRVPKCKACGDEATLYCGGCMKHAHCEKKSCDPIGTAHGCQPWFFLVGGTGDKRQAGSEEEHEREAESRYMRLLAAYRRTQDAAILEQLEEAFGGMSLEKQREHEAGEPCHDKRDMITFDDIADLEPDNVVYIFENNIKYCYNLDAFKRYLKTRNISPVSKRPFTAEEMARVEEAASTRVLSVWEHWRNADDANPAALDEWEQTLHHSYGVAEHTIQDARKVRAQKHVQEIYASPSAGNVLSHWRILRNTYQASVSDIEWSRFWGSLSTKTVSRLLTSMLTSWMDVRDFLYDIPGMREKYWASRTFWQAVVPKLLGPGENPPNYTAYGQEKVTHSIVRPVGGGQRNMAKIYINCPLHLEADNPIRIRPAHRTVKSLRHAVKLFDVPPLMATDMVEVTSDFVQCWTDVLLNGETIADEPDVETEYPPNPDRTIRRLVTNEMIANPDNRIDIVFVVDYNAPRVRFRFVLPPSAEDVYVHYEGDELVSFGADMWLSLKIDELLSPYAATYTITVNIPEAADGGGAEEHEMDIDPNYMAVNIVGIVREVLTDNQLFGPWISSGAQTCDVIIRLHEK